MNEIVPVIAKNIGGVLISAASVTLYYVSTQNQTQVIRIASIGSNFFVNWWAAYNSLDYLTSSNHSDIHLIEEGSKCAGTLKKIAAVLGSVICSTPYGVAAYTFTQGSTPVRLGFAAMEFAGNIPLYLYALSNFIENDLTRASNFTHNLIQNVFCSGNETEIQLARDIELVRGVVIQQFRRIIEEIKSGNLDLDEINPERLETTEEDQLKQFINKLPRVSQTPGFWQNCCGKSLKVMGEGAKFVIKSASAGIMIYSSVGYECSTKQQFTEQPFYLKEFPSWALATVAMIPLYYLCFQAGWDVADALCTTAGNLMQGKFIKPNIWKISGNKFGPLLQILLPLVAGLLAYKSGYTSRNLYEKQCPASFQFKGAGDTVDYSTDIFNGIYVYTAFSASFVGMLNLFGGDQEKTYLQILTMAESTLAKIERMSRQKFLAYSKNTLTKLDQNQLTNLLGDSEDEDSSKIAESSPLLLQNDDRLIDSSPRAAFNRLLSH